MLLLKIFFVLTLPSLITATGYRFFEYNQTLDSKAAELTLAQNIALSFQWTFIVDQIIKEKFHTPAIQNATWTYALCDKSISDNERDFECTVYLETHDLNNKVTYREECQTSLTNITEREHRSFIRVYRFGKGKSILLWQNSDKTVYLDVIHFPDCELMRTHLKLAQKMTDCANGCIDVAVRNDEEYDVFYAKVTKNSAVWYFTSYDDKGKSLREPKEFLRTSLNSESDSSVMDRFSIVPMTPGSNIQSHLVLALDYESKSYAWFLDKNGSRTKPPTDAEIHIASTAHNRLGFCSIKNNILTCQQLDENGTKKLEKTIKLQNYGKSTSDYLSSHIFGFRIATIHNLPEGGFILVIEDCVNLKVCIRPSDPYRLYMFKVGADGTRYRTIVVQNLSRERHGLHFVEPYGILEVEEKEYCLYKNYVLKGKGHSTQLVVECFSDEILSQNY